MKVTSSVESHVTLFDVEPTEHALLIRALELLPMGGYSASIQALHFSMLKTLKNPEKPQ